MPHEMVLRLDRLPPYNRTRHVNQAVAAYLDVQKRTATNRYGVDCHYMRNKMAILMRDMDNYTPAELKRELDRMAGVLSEGVINESV